MYNYKKVYTSLSYTRLELIEILESNLRSDNSLLVDDTLLALESLLIDEEVISEDITINS